MKSKTRLYPILFALLTLVVFGAGCGGAAGEMAAAPPPDAMASPAKEPAAVAGDAASTTSDRNRASARTKVQALVFEDWGTPKERVTERLVTLELGKEKHAIALVTR